MTDANAQAIIMISDYPYDIFPITSPPYVGCLGAEDGAALMNAIATYPNIVLSISQPVVKC